MRKLLIVAVVAALCTMPLLAQEQVTVTSSCSGSSSSCSGSYSGASCSGSTSCSGVASCSGLSRALSARRTPVRNILSRLRATRLGR